MAVLVRLCTWQELNRLSVPEMLWLFITLSSGAILTS